MLVKEHGVRSIFFVDDEFITESARRRRVIGELIEEIPVPGVELQFLDPVPRGHGEPMLLRSLKEVGLRSRLHWRRVRCRERTPTF